MAVVELLVAPLKLGWILASLLLALVVPGYCLSKVLFPGKTASLVERAALSIALSVTALPLTVLGLNYLLNIKITTESVMAAILLIVLPSIVVYVLEMLVIRRMEELGGSPSQQARARRSSSW